MSRSRKAPIEYAPVSSQLFRSPEEIQAEQQGDTSGDMSPGGESEHTHARTRVRMSYNIRPEQDLDLEEVQKTLRLRTGKKPTKSELVEEAIDLLTEKYRT